MMRANHVALVAGKRGTGKTTWCKKIIANERKKVLIIDTIDHESYRDIQVITPNMLRGWTSGIVRIYGDEDVISETFDMINKYVLNALIIIEDAIKIFETNVPKNAKKMIVDSKQKNFDIIMLYHAFAFVQPTLFRYSDSVTIFKTNEDIRDCKTKIPNFIEVQKAYEIVAKSKNPYANKFVKL